MSQHDYSLDNAAGAAFRSDLNSALAAIVSLNSGASAPSTTFAYMFWADTTTGLLKIRNAANSAWVTVGVLASLGFAILDAAGDLMYASAADTVARLAIGAAYRRLAVNAAGTAPEWVADTQNTVVTTAGDIMYATANRTLTRLGIGAARQVLAVNAGATAPEWVASLQSLMTGTGDIIQSSGANTPARLAIGTAKQTLRVNSGATAVEWTDNSTITTPVATTSGTSVNISTSIPSWVNKVTLVLSGVSLVSTAVSAVQIGSGSFATSGYESSAGQYIDTLASSTTRFLLASAGVASAPMNGELTLRRKPSSNLWVCSFSFRYSTTITNGGGEITLGGALDRLRVVSSNDTDTFNAGSAWLVLEA